MGEARGQHLFDATVASRIKTVIPTSKTSPAIHSASAGRRAVGRPCWSCGGDENGPPRPTPCETCAASGYVWSMLESSPWLSIKPGGSMDIFYAGHSSYYKHPCPHCRGSRRMPCRQSPHGRFGEQLDLSPEPTPTVQMPPPTIAPTHPPKQRETEVRRAAVAEALLPMGPLEPTAPMQPLTPTVRRTPVPKLKYGYHVGHPYKDGIPLHAGYMQCPIAAAIRRAIAPPAELFPKRVGR